MFTSFEDFLGNTVEVGDMVVYTPKNRFGELVLGELLEIGKGRWELPSIIIQPLDGTDKTRYRDNKLNLETDEFEWVPRIPKKVTLPDSSSVMLYKKKESHGS